jgi:hypothetical protein
MRPHWLLALAFLLPVGCSSPKFAPVSGKVTLNGKALANAQVIFNPIPPEGSIEAGPSAVGTTNDKGEYTLRVSDKQSGAPVGKHKVVITLMGSGGGESDAPVPVASGVRNLLPKKYNEDSELTCDILPGGNDHANFDLTSP